MKLNCKSYIDIPDSNFQYMLKLYIKIKQPYKSIFGNLKYKNKETNITLVRNSERYDDFLNECIEYLNKEGVREEMIKDAMRAVKRFYGVSEEQIEKKKKENELMALTDKFNFEFEVEI